jgi:hypothetical protein
VRARSLARAAVPLLIAAAALVVRELTRAPLPEPPAPGTPRGFTPPAELVRAASAPADGDFVVDPDLSGGAWLPANADGLESADPLAVGGGALHVDTRAGRVELELTLEPGTDSLGDPRRRGRLTARFEPGVPRASVVPGVRSAELRATLARDGRTLELPMRLHWIALEDGTWDALLIGASADPPRAGIFALELRARRP